MLNAQRQRLALSEADTALERNKANQLKDTLAREQALTRATEKRGEVIRQVSEEARREEGRLRKGGRLEDASRFGTLGDLADRAGASERKRAFAEEAKLSKDRESLAAREARTVAAEHERAEKARTQRTLSEIDARMKARKQARAQEVASLRSEVSGRTLTGLPVVGGPRKNDRERESAIEQQRVRDLKEDIRELGEVRQRAERRGDESGRARAYNQEQAAARELTQAHERLGKAVRGSGHATNMHTVSMIRNAGTAAAWLLPIQAAYGALRLLRSGMRDLIEIDRDFATLGAVFDSTAESTRQLKRDLLDVGVAQGSKDALDSGIRFARLQTTAVQNINLTRDALVAQNVAEISAAEGAEFLASIIQSYKLTLSDVPGVLNRVNELSNNWNVTNKDLIAGLQRVSGIAQQAGFSLQNLEGVLASTIGASGRPGAEIGNALKFIITRIRRSEVQTALKNAFDIDLRGPTGEIKQFDEILETLARKYPTLTKLQQADFLDLAAGSRQASRLALVLENYTQGQLLAAQASARSNSAYEENERILASLENRINSLSASWGKLFDAMGDAGVTNVFSAVLDGMTSSLTRLDRFIEKYATGPAKAPRAGIENARLASIVEDFKGPDTVLGNVADRLSKAPGAVGNLSRLGRFFGLGRRKPEAQDLISLKDDKEFLAAVKAEGLENELTFKLTSLGVDDAALGAANVTRHIKILEGELNGMERATTAFDKMAADVLLPGQSLEEISKLAENAAASFGLLTETEEATTKAAGDYLEKVRAAQKTGDRQTISDVFQETGAQFEAGKGEKRVELTRRAGEGKAILDGELKALEQRRTAINGDTRALLEQQDTLRQTGEVGSEAFFATVRGMDELKQAATKVNNGIQEVEENLRAVRSVTEEKPSDDGLLGSLRDRFAVIKEFQESAKGLIGGGGAVTGADVRAQVEAELSLQRELLNVIEKQALAQVEKARADKVAGVQAAAEKRGAEQQEEVSGIFGRAGVSLGQQSELSRRLLRQRRADAAEIEKINEKAADQVGGLTSQFAARRNSFEGKEVIEAQRKGKIKATEEDLNLARAAGKRVAEGFAAGVSIGLTDTDKRLSRAKELLSREEFVGPPAPGRGALDVAKDQGERKQIQATLRADVNALAQRELQIVSEIENVELRRVEAQRKQGEQRSKSLTLAGREEQVTAAIAAKELKRRQDEAAKTGGAVDRLNLNQVAFLPQNLKTAVTQFTPDLLNDRARGILDPVEQTARTDTRALKEEAQRIAQSVGQLSTAVANFSPGNLDAALAEALKGQLTANQVASTKPVEQAPPQFNIELGDVKVSLDKEFKVGVEVIAGQLRAEVTRQLNAIREQIGGANPAAVTNGSTGD
jgi:TP901 family phage tail tape measure protein